MDTKKIIMIILIIIIFIIFINMICSLCQSKRPRQQVIISPFTQTESKTDNKYDLGYANVTDPFDYPYILKEFISEDQCKKIIEHAKDKLFDSEVIGGKYTEIRNSQQCWIPKNDPLVKPLFEKISAKYNIPFENAEDLQVVRYKPNQYYNEHHDSCCDNNKYCEDFVKRGGQRIITVLIYLTNDFDEGNTYFRNLDKKFKPPTGDAIVFFPLAKNSNKCHPLSLHAGMPVTSGEKWVANLWYRENKFT